MSSLSLGSAGGYNHTSGKRICEKLLTVPKRLSELSFGDVARCIRQKIFLDYLVPEALRRLWMDPTGGDLYTGELLQALYDMEDSFWNNKLLLNEQWKILGRLKDKTLMPKNVIWGYDEEEDEFYELVEKFIEKLTK